MIADAKKKPEGFRARKAELSLARKLRGIANEIGRMSRALANKPGVLEHTLRRYSELLRPFAEATAARTIAEVSRRDETQWAQAAKGMTRELRREIRQAPTGILLQGLMREQVRLITSLPLEAAERVHEWAIKGMESQVRAEEVAQQILRSGQVSKGRANLIARTEVARASSGLVQARAIYIGSDGYIWRTVEDSDVRPSHRKMNGKFVRWDKPPMLDGLVGHAGQLPNCRCYPEPVIPDEAD